MHKNLDRLFVGSRYSVIFANIRCISYTTQAAATITAAIRIFNPLTPTVATWVQTGLSQLFVIVDIRTL